MIFKRKQLAVLVGHACAAVAFVSVSSAQEATQRVEVTGSSIKRTLEEQGTLPVQIVSRDDIAKAGAVNMEQLMNSLPSVSAAGAVVRGMGAGNSTYGRSSVSLRGLGDNRTLILVDGRRLAPFGTSSSAVDINSIPSESIERIEVLTDGASSIYGSDAMAGVINFITRKDFQGLEVSADVGNPSRDGGGKSNKVGVTMGYGSFAQDKFNVMLSASVESQTELVARDRDYAKSGNRPPFFTNGATGGGNIEGVWDTALGDTAALNGGGPLNPLGLRNPYYGNPLGDAPVSCNQDGHFSVANTAAPSVGGFNCNYDSAAAVRLIPKSEKQNLAASMRFKLDADKELYANWSRVSNTTLQVYQPAPVRSSFLVTDTAFAGSGVSPALLIRPTNPNYPTAWLNAHGLGAMVGRVLAVTQRAFVAGERTNLSENLQNRVTVGLKGVYKGWDFDTAFTRDQSTVNGQLIDGYFSQLGLARAVNNTTDNWNPWAAGGVQPANVTAAVAAAKYVGPAATGSFTSTGWDGRISNSVGQLTGGDIAVSLGAEFRHQVFDLTTPAILGSGDIAGLGGAVLPVTRGRNISSFFGEINLPILKNLETNISVRSDRYNDLQKDGSPITGKVSVRYTPINMVSIRSSYGTGFRAPALSELFTPITLGTTEQFTDPVAGSNYQANSITGGNPTLVPETSKQWSLGTVVTPMKNVSLRADYFSITIDEYVTVATAQALVNQAGGVANQFVTFLPNGAANSIDQRAINAGLAKFSGIDFGANWSDKFSFGRLTVDYNATRMTKASLKTPDGTEDAIGTQVDAAGATLKLVSLGGTILKYKHKLSLDWAYGPVGVTLTQNYTDGYEDGNTLTPTRHFVPSYSIYDAQVRYTGIKSLSLAVGAKNLLDKDPPLYINTTNFFAYGYDPAQYDPLGRFIYAKLTYKF